MPVALRILTRGELIRLIAIRMAARDRSPPILCGKAAPGDAWERDRLRKDFATWFVEESTVQGGLKVVDAIRPHTESDMAGIDRWRRATQPQLWSCVRRPVRRYQNEDLRTPHSRVRLRK